MSDAVTARQLVDAIEVALDFAYRIEQTGGGTATIYVGGDDQVAIGPGVYDWADAYESIFDWQDLYVGLTNEDDAEAVQSIDELVAAVEELIQISNTPQETPDVTQLSDDLKNRLNYHAPDAIARDNHELIRATIRIAASNFESLLPEIREKSLSITKLEESMFWANAAIARHDAEGNRR
jgi:hypothetical protein